MQLTKAPVQRVQQESEKDRAGREDDQAGSQYRQRNMINRPMEQVVMYGRGSRKDSQCQQDQSGTAEKGQRLKRAEESE